MHSQLETLLEIQDLKTQRADLLEQSESRGFEEEVFNISADEALQQLDEKIEEMEESLEAGIHSRYRRLAGSRGRFVVPVINGTCFGCFVSIPTAVASEAERNEVIRFCDNCGRFLYLVG
ncbi:MAG: C4-type zinc ribbon domain-containing protein [Gemmatimonadota bacterium]